MDRETALDECARRYGLLPLPGDEAASAQTRRLLRAGQLRRVRSGVFCDRPELAPSFEERVVAALLIAPPGSLGCSLSALRLWRLDGLPHASATEPIHLLVPGGRHRRLLGCRFSDGSAPMWIVRGIPCVALSHATLDYAAGSSFGRAFVIIEAALRGPTSTEDLHRELARGHPRRGVVVLRRALANAGRLSETPLESMARVLWIDAALPPPLQQAVILAAGRFLARVDFLWPEALLVVEVDGLGKYSRAGEIQAEKRRQNLLVSAGYTVLRFSWDDIAQDGLGVVAAVRAALSC